MEEQAVANGESELRLTPQRLEILRALRGMPRHPDASEVFERVRRELPHISLATVYRNLAQLSQVGLVQELSIGRARRWDARLDPHEHVVCRRCGRVADLDIADETQRLEVLANRASGFVVEGHQARFEGLCLDCQREAAADA